MKKSFALGPGGPPRLTITYPGNAASAQVLLDGQQVMAFATKADFQRGTTARLPDGSILTVRFGTIAGVPYLKGVHVIHNGRPVPGSAADPVPAWAWIFLIACALVPVVTLGGGLPALIGFSGVAGTLTVSRLSRWSTALRAGVCALISVACWGALAVLVLVYAAGTASYQPQQVHAKSTVAMSPTDRLIHDIGVTYYQHGYLQSNIERIKDDLYDHCDQMQPAQCSDYLNQELLKAKNSPTVE